MSKTSLFSNIISSRNRSLMSQKYLLWRRMLCAHYHDDENSSFSLDGMKQMFAYKNKYTLEETPIKDPMFIFKTWFADAVDCTEVANPTIMCLATSTTSGVPSLRYMFCETHSSKGFTFFTHGTSRKGEELKDNPAASMCFFWAPLLRTVRIEGVVEKLPSTVSDELFNKKNYEAQVNIHCSAQSSRLKSCLVLKEREAEVRAKFQPSKIPRPEHFGWYNLKPNVFEFWQLKSTKERLRFRKLGEKEVLDEITRKGEKDWVYECMEP